MSAVRRDQITAQTSEDKELAWAGIPQTFWHVDLSDFRFCQCNFYGRPLSTPAQRNWVRALTRYGGSSQNRLIVIGSHPTDQGAIALGCYLLRKWLARGVEIGMIPVSAPYFSKYPRGLLLHNVLDKSTVSQIELTRNHVVQHHWCTKIICVAGSVDPWRFAVQRLLLYPNTTLCVQDIVPVVTT